MPTHFTKGIKVQLVTASLPETTTTAPEAKKSSLATHQVDFASDGFRNGQVLHEKKLPVNGDDFRLHYLGEYQDMPFMMARAGAELLQSSTPERQATSTLSHDEPHLSNSSSSLTSLESTPSITPEDIVMGDPNPNEVHTETHINQPLTNSPEQVNANEPLQPINSPHLSECQDIPSQPLTPTMSEPQGVCLRVELTTKSFVVPIDGKGQVDDIKIDVFFNGQFSHSALWPARWSSVKNQKEAEMTKQFAGARTHYLLERAWVILPGHLEADGTARDIPQEDAASPRERWDEIAATLKEEADSRGTNDFEERTVVGDYLVNLADVDMPYELDTIYLGGRKFGVIDMVLTFGKGKKHDASQTYLLTPTRMNNPGFIPSLPVMLHGPVGSYLTGAISDAGINVNLREFGGPGGKNLSASNRKSTNTGLLSSPSTKDALRGHRGKMPLFGATSLPATQDNSLNGHHRTGQMHMASRPADVSQIESTPQGYALLSQTAQSPETPDPLSRSSGQRMMSPPGPTSGSHGRTLRPRSSTFTYSPSRGRSRRYRQQGAGEVEGLVGISRRGIFTDATSPTAHLFEYSPNANIEVPEHPPLQYLPSVLTSPHHSTLVKEEMPKELSRRQSEPTIPADRPRAGPSVEVQPTIIRQPSASAQTRSRGLSSASTQSHSTHLGFPPPIPEQGIAALTPGPGKETSPSSDVMTPYQKRRVRHSRNMADEMEQSFKTFVTPPLSQNCVLTYAQPRSDAVPGVRGAGGGVVRQIKCERQGDFEEKGVLLGVRFIVG